MSRPRKTTTKTSTTSRGGPRTQGRLQKALDETARREIQAALKETSGNVTAAASALGISRRGLWKRMTVLGIDPDPHRP